MNRSTRILAATVLAAFFAGCEKSPPSADAPVSAGGENAVAATKQNPADWPKDAVWYQIFPDRFHNGDPSNDPTRASLEWPINPSAKWRVTPWTGDWYARDAWETEIGPDFYRDGVLDRRYGGDLQGVLDKLDYLADLGINAIYFNPVFYSRSLHKYDGNSYHHIDPFLGPNPSGDLAMIEKETGGDPSTWQWTGADKLFLRVLAEAHRRGIRVVLDGVFNHTGRDFFAFRDLEKNQERSKYRDWYVVESFDDPQTKRDEFDYKGWWGHKTLPVFAASADGKDIAPGPKAYIDAATKRWMDPNADGDPSDGIDGWRLDVAPERPPKFWREWNAHVRALNPNAYTSCEIWSDPSYLIADGGFTACMNYHAFAIPVKGFLMDAKIRASQFARLLDDRRNALPKYSVDTMQNLLDSHDTDRLASMIVNSDIANYSDPEVIEYNKDSEAHSSAAYKIRKPDARERAIQKLVVLFQATYAGAPMIYYGDEAGMWGGNDPDDRQPMVWSGMKFAPQGIDPRGTKRTPDEVAFDAGLHQFYKQAIALRRKHEALRRGDFRVAGVFDEAQTLAFQRRSGEGSLLVVLNRSEKEQSVRIELPPEVAAKYAKAKVIFSTNDSAAPAVTGAGASALTVKLPPISGAVISP